MSLMSDEMSESNLIKFFGDNPFNRMIDVFIGNVGETFTKKEVQDLSGISKGALFLHWHKLEELNLIKVTKTLGKTKLFTLNTSNKLVKDLLKLEARMIEETSPKIVLAKT